MVNEGELWCEADAKPRAEPGIGREEAGYGRPRGGLTDVASNCPNPEYLAFLGPWQWMSSEAVRAIGQKQMEQQT